MDNCALENKANKYICYIYSWLCFNKLTLNLDKTSYTTFIFYKPHTFNISLNGLPIKYTNVFKLLGVTIDNRLNWKLHITILASQLSIILVVIYKLRHKTDKQSLLLLYNSLFHSRLTYSAASWGSNYKHTLNKIIILQNKILKCIYKLPLISNIDVIYKRHILKLCDIVNITLLKNAHIAYTINANTNLLCKLVKSTYMLTRPRSDTHLLFLNVN